MTDRCLSDDYNTATTLVVPPSSEFESPTIVYATSHRCLPAFPGALRSPSSPPRLETDGRCGRDRMTRLTLQLQLRLCRWRLLLQHSSCGALLQQFHEVDGCLRSKCIALQVHVAFVTAVESGQQVDVADEVR